MLGATAYGAYQLGKLSGRFSSYGGYGGGSRYGWNDYNRSEMYKITFSKVYQIIDQ